MNKNLILLHLSLIDGVGPVTIQALRSKSLRSKSLHSKSLCENTSRSNFSPENLFHKNKFFENNLLESNLMQDKLSQASFCQASLVQNSLCDKDLSQESFMQEKFLNEKLENFELQDLYLLERSDFVSMFGLSQLIAGKVYLGLRDIGLLEKEVGLMSKNNVNFVTIESQDYPELLKNIYAPPAVLYVKSERSDWKSTLNYDKKVAFVGSRKANSYGEKIIENMVPVMIENDWVIVSGGAIGADSMAHAKTVACGGLAIAIIGSGLLNPYPSSNEKLFNDILATGGQILSPFGMQTVARPGNFPARNRVIAGLSLGCVVVQAAKKSGASITAQFALDCGREVFAVPGLIDDELSLGCHALIQQGAKLISDAQDILSELPGFVPEKIAFNKQAVTEKSQQVSKQVPQKQVSRKQFFVENNSEKAQQDGIKAANIIESLKVKSQKSKNYKSESFACKYKENTLEFEIIRICARASSIDEIAVATNKELQDLHETLFDMQINGDIKQNYAGMFEII